MAANFEADLAAIDRIRAVPTILEVVCRTTGMGFAAILFQPFFRVAARPGQHGLGLGLYIAREIAAAHGGTLAAASSANETRFTFRMPV